MENRRFRAALEWLLCWLLYLIFCAAMLGLTVYAIMNGWNPY